MSRLPRIGGDDGNWGQILNDFLLVEHATDGTLKNVARLSDVSVKADDTKVIHTTSDEIVGGVKTFVVSPKAPLPTQSTDIANKSYVDSLVGSGVVAASATQLGTIQLAGDLNGSGSTATNPVVANGAITTDKLADGSVTNNKLADGSVNTAQLAAGSVTSNELANGTIVNTDIAPTAAIARGKLDSSTQASLAKADSALQIAPVTTVNGQTGSVTLTKNDVGLSNVDNTSDTAKNSAPATLTNKTLSGADNTFTNISQSAVVNLANDLAARATLQNPIFSGVVSTPQLAINTTNNTATHSLTLGAASTGIALYNTADQTSNFERLSLAWSSNVFTMLSEAGGSATARQLCLASASTSLTLANSGSFRYQFSFAATSTTALSFIGQLNGSAGIANGLSISPTILQTAAAGYAALLVNTAESSVGTGPRLLADFQTGSVSKLSVASSGLITASNRIANVSDPQSAQDVATKNYVDTTRFEGIQALGSSSGSITVDLSVAPNFSLTLSANTIITFVNVPQGSRVTAVTLYVSQDSTGGRTLDITGRQGAFGSNALANLSTGAGMTDEVICRSIDGGSHWIVSLGAQSIA